MSLELSSIAQLSLREELKPKFQAIPEDFERFSESNSSLIKELQNEDSPSKFQDIKLQDVEGSEDNRSFESFEYLDYEVNIKRIGIANTDLFEPLATDEEDEFINNPEYLF